MTGNPSGPFGSHRAPTDPPGLMCALPRRKTYSAREVDRGYRLIRKSHLSDDFSYSIRGVEKRCKELQPLLRVRAVGKNPRAVLQGLNCLRCPAEPCQEKSALVRGFLPEDPSQARILPSRKHLRPVFSCRASGRRGPASTRPPASRFRHATDRAPCHKRQRRLRIFSGRKECPPEASARFPGTSPGGTPAPGLPAFERRRLRRDAGRRCRQDGRAPPPGTGIRVHGRDGGVSLLGCIGMSDSQLAFSEEEKRVPYELRLRKSDDDLPVQVLRGGIIARTVQGAGKPKHRLGEQGTGPRRAPLPCDSTWPPANPCRDLPTPLRREAPRVARRASLRSRQPLPRRPGGSRLFHSFPA